MLNIEASLGPGCPLGREPFGQKMDSGWKPGKIMPTIPLEIIPLTFFGIVLSVE